MQAPWKPDFAQFLKVMRREPTERPVLFEHYVEKPFLYRILGDDVWPDDDPPWGWVRNALTAYGRLGFDTVELGLGWLTGTRFKTRQHQEGTESLSLNDGWMISDEESFTHYAWPDPDAPDTALWLDRVASVTPAGMKLLVGAPGGVYENLVNLIGFDNLCLMTADNPGLVQRVCDRIGACTLRTFERSLPHPVVGGLVVCDDWGFKTSTFLPPALLRALVFPWHRRYVEAAHRHGKVAVLHACGQVAGVMDDVIDDLHYDAKHSFEDVILPVEQAYAQYGGRIAILGGLDVDYLSHASPAEVRRRARALLHQTRHGGYALGSGNSIADGVPHENFAAILEAAWEGYGS